ncbi:unnamed protein product [Prorocentrum cordatum]|uniref:Subtilisin n=1 Tax=Prorocentrum cordatum TaxID=2364126 RepID=A0ABN9PV10_9DINO|nr:unnamed protein product [Polarella glacialis]
MCRRRASGCVPGHRTGRDTRRTRRSGPGEEVRAEGKTVFDIQDTKHASTVYAGVACAGPADVGVYKVFKMPGPSSGLPSSTSAKQIEAQSVLQYLQGWQC